MGLSPGPVGFPVMLFRDSQAHPNEFLFGGGGTHTTGGFLLEHVEDLHSLGERHGVGSPVSVPLEILHEFHDAPGNPLPERPGSLRMIAVLSVEQRRPEDVLNLLGQCPQVLQTGADEMKGPTLPTTHAGL
jgi:hypothetical protein